MNQFLRNISILVIAAFAFNVPAAASSVVVTGPVTTPAPFTVPSGSGLMWVRAWGAGGSGGSNSGGYIGTPGGGGGYASAVFQVTPGQMIYFLVGSGGGAHSATEVPAPGLPGGSSENYTADQGAGGGYTGVFTSAVPTQATALIIAGGGAGGGRVTSAQYGNGDGVETDAVIGGNVFASASPLQATNQGGGGYFGGVGVAGSSYVAPSGLNAVVTTTGNGTVSFNNSVLTPGSSQAGYASPAAMGGAGGGAAGNTGELLIQFFPPNYIVAVSAPDVLATGEPQSPQLISIPGGGALTYSIDLGTTSTTATNPGTYLVHWSATNGFIGSGTTTWTIVPQRTTFTSSVISPKAFTIPVGAGSMTVQAWGGSGSGGSNSGGYVGTPGGAGGYARATFAVSAGQVFYYQVASGGGAHTATQVPAPGLPGGSYESYTADQGGGGGYTGVFTSAVPSQATALVVAGGGAGGGRVTPEQYNGGLGTETDAVMGGNLLASANPLQATNQGGGGYVGGVGVAGSSFVAASAINAFVTTTGYGVVSFANSVFAPSTSESGYLAPAAVGGAGGGGAGNVGELIITLLPQAPSTNVASVVPLGVTYSGVAQTPVFNTIPSGASYSYTIVGGTTATSATNAGTYTVNWVATGEFSGSGSTTWTIAQAPLSITANDQSKIAGDPNPPLSVTFNGFVNGEPSSVLSGVAAISTTATDASPAGTYPIVPSLGTLSAKNYTFSAFINGTLTVTPRPDTVPPVLSLPNNLVVEATGPSGAIVLFSASANDDVSGPVPVSYSVAPGSTFGLGTTPVTITANDSAGNVATGTFTVTVRDTTPPTIVVPSNIVAEATSAAGAAVSFTATAADLVDGSVAVSADHASGSVFPLGTTTVNLSATDSHGNVAHAVFTVTVRDTIPPVIAPQPNLVAEATSAAGATISFAPSATDNVSGTVSVQAAPASGSVFPLGNTTVVLTATDSSGNTATSSFVVTVEDTTPPTLTLPSNQVLEATSAAGAVATFTANAVDSVSTPTITYSVPPGSTFPLGANVVTVTAVDGAGNQSSGTFTIAVRDTTAPTILAPGNITVDSTNSAGAIVTYTASANDLVSGVVAVASTMPSGSTFPIGTTTVILTAVDAAGNVATATFTVTVLGPAQQVGALLQQVTGSTTIPPNQVGSLSSKLNAAQSSIAKGNINAASGQLSAFVRQVEALVNSGRMSASDAQPLVDAANAIIGQL